MVGGSGGRVPDELPVAEVVLGAGVGATGVGAGAGATAAGAPVMLPFG
jgi:hypothetical protein